MLLRSPMESVDTVTLALSICVEPLDKGLKIGKTNCGSVSRKWVYWYQKVLRWGLHRPSPQRAKSVGRGLLFLQAELCRSDFLLSLNSGFGNMVKECFDKPGNACYNDYE